MALSWQYDLDGVDWEALSALYQAAPLGDKSAAHLQKVFSNSMFRCFAYEAGQLLAAGRALADGGDCAYLCDIAVLPSHQGRGLGKQVVRQLLAATQGHRKVILYAVPGREDFYRQLGFLRMQTAMAIFDNPQLQLERGYLSED
ncbi:GNAT family N-acetyltransferase [Chitinimonas taiwanensis]|uniref:Acetyltransferase (GNAT) domain-containing protein n=1 Tax=Chitinimonas taiwanensis DSM 18899 TaxID=1121279 RepID=A0A1K2HQ03_9NEIS|nr:GNAT family N-acetyltransferase [Chitinimonas taiwanensis]SFZ78839.1 Acetyltransferase (GNAT) domain-containing protein [Chitinimonas taiwanensis DSM 18899]